MLHQRAPCSGSRPVASQRTAAPVQRKVAVTCQAKREVAGAAALATATAFMADAAQAAEVLQTATADAGSLTMAISGGAAIAGLGAVLIATDPNRRRAQQMAETDGDEKEAVRKYFNAAGYERFKKIYDENEAEVNKVQLDIRNGHAQTVDKVLKWLDEEGGVDGITVADCGCGTGSLATPLALRGAAVSASDISAAMASEAQQRFEQAVKESNASVRTPPKFEALDLESVTGRYHTVTCLDVMIHYPQNKVDEMVAHLASLSEQRLIISFAPYTPWLGLLKRIGELFPGPSKATRAYLHAEADVEAALNKAGFKVTKREMTATSFYFSRLLEAVRA